MSTTTQDAAARARYLRDKVMTATPAQRVVMLFERFSLDLTRAQDAYAAGNTDGYKDNLGHGMEILAELQSSLNITVGGPTLNLSQLYTHLLLELIKARGGDVACVAGAQEMVLKLGESFRTVAEQTAPTASAGASGAWIS